MRKSHLLYALPIGTLLLSACGSGSSSETPGGSDDAATADARQAGQDGGGDGDDISFEEDAQAAPDASADATVETDSGDAATVDEDARADGGTDATAPGDSGAIDAGADAGTDAAADAGLDASTNVDAATLEDAGVDAGPTYTIGGTLSGLAAGDSVVLQDNLGDNLTLSANAPFTFHTPLGNGAPYAVSVLTSPTAPVSQACTVTSDISGHVAGAAVGDVLVSCTTNPFTVGATVTGVAAGETVTLTDDVGDSVVVGNGSFAFATLYKSGASYTVAAPTQPTSPILQTCAIADATDTVGNANVNLAVTCTSTPFALGGTVHGLGSGKSLVLSDGVSGQTLNVSSNGSFAFGSKIANGNGYSVVVSTQPTNVSGEASPQLCNVIAGKGTEPTADVTNVQVYCGTNCAAVHGANPILGSGNFAIDPDGSGPGAAFQAYCDMSFTGGGWTLIQSTSGGCGASSEVAGIVGQGSCADMPLASMEALANLSGTVHVRTASGNVDPTQYVTSATALPIGNLRAGLLLDANEDDTTAEAQWTTANVPVTALDFSASCMGTPARAWPSIYWACGNQAGWHLIDTNSTWHYATANVSMEVYVR